MQAKLKEVINMKGVVFMVCLLRSMILVSCKIGAADETFHYEKHNNFGLGHKPIENYRRSASAGKDYARQFFQSGPHPAKLPEPKPVVYPSPYRNIYQGIKRDGDKRVYNHKFDYEPKSFPHQIYANGLFNCIVTHLAVETQEGVPILLRGGVGYRFFTLIVKAKAGIRLAGRIRAFCRRPPEEGIDVHAKVDV